LHELCGLSAGLIVPFPGKFSLQTENHFVKLLAAQRDKMVTCLFASLCRGSCAFFNLV